MKRKPPSASKILDQFFARSKPTYEQVESSRRQVLRRLNLDESYVIPVPNAAAAGRVQTPMQKFEIAIALIAVVAAIVGGSALVQSFVRGGNRTIATNVEGILYRLTSEQPQVIQAGEKIERDARIRSNEGGVFALADGSRVEVRAQSELSLERASDGIRIRLTKGSVIVNAAKQHKGHLYVQTNDVTVSVVGTVFLVDSESEGSRVAVIEGEVHVQHGAAEQRLRRGEQVVTTPFIEPPLLKEEISWSRNAEAHLALLQQPAASTAAKVGTVTGIVLTTSGRPASGFRVGAMRADTADSFRAMLSLTETDSTGRYQLESVPPGRYYITVADLDLLTYYPGTLDVTKASALAITSAAIVSDIDFVIQDPSAAPPPPRKLLPFNPNPPPWNLLARGCDQENTAPYRFADEGRARRGSNRAVERAEDPRARMLREILKGVGREPLRGLKAPESPAQK